MTHLTLNTGHVSQAPRSSVGPEAVAALLQLVGGGLLPGAFSAFRVEAGRCDGGATFSLHRGRDALVMCGVVILPALVLTSRDDMGWIGDWERCFAWALLDEFSNE